MSEDSDLSALFTSAGEIGPRSDIESNVLSTVHYSLNQTERVSTVLARLYAARRSVRLYPPNHPAAKESILLLGDAIRSYHDEGVDLQFVFYNDEILMGDQLLPRESLQFDQLVRDIAATGMNSVIFRCGILDREVEEFVGILARDVAEVQSSGGVEQMVAGALMPHVEVSTVIAMGCGSKARGDGVSGEPSAVLNGAVALVREMDRLFHGDASVSGVRVKGVVNALVDCALENRHALLRMSSLKDYDEYTYHHCANVAAIALGLGSQISTDERFLGALGIGGLLHDLGVLTVGPSISNKPGPLTPEEWEVIRTHPIAGAEMVALLPGVDRSAVVTVFEHHMRWDGTGYPENVHGRTQHLTSRIVAIADAYDAMTSERSYSPARLPDDAMSEVVRAAGGALDPALVGLFVRLLGAYPPGSVVRLSTGSVAVVLAAGADQRRPLVRVIASPDGDLVAPRDLNLAETLELEVLHCIDPAHLNVSVRDYL